MQGAIYMTPSTASSEGLNFKDNYVSAKSNLSSTFVESQRNQTVAVRLNAARVYLHANYSQPIDVKAASEIACLDYYYFIRQFKAQFNQTPYQYLMTRRLEVASALLKTSKKNVTEICHEIGFIDLPSFSRLFKRHFGVPPTAYRLRGPHQVKI